MKPAEPFCIAPNETVLIIAPSSKSTLKELRLAIKLLKSWGLRPKAPKGLLGKDILCAQSDATRLKLLLKALQGPHRVLWALRGGYGCIRLWQGLSKIKPSKPKLLIGHSDITVLHGFLNHFCKVPTLHGPNLKDLISPGVLNASSLKMARALVDRPYELFAPLALQPMNARPAPKGALTLVGGNLSVWDSLLGKGLKDLSVWQGKAVALEDHAEPPYKIDKMLCSLNAGGFFAKTRALIWGQVLHHTPQNTSNKTAPNNLTWQIIKRFAKEQKFPVYKGLPIGHGTSNKMLPLGVQVRIKAAPAKTKPAKSGAALALHFDEM